MQYRYHDVRPSRDGLNKLSELIQAGKLRPHVRKQFALEDVQAALKRSAIRRGRGKMVIDLTK